MLTREENDLLCRVGPGTLMGDLIRQYWLPVLLSHELAERDGPPLRVRLLGEDLIAFRDTSGQVGLLANNCPHRGASLFFGRNEEHGLRCVYHGWKYDVQGRCVDMPNEPPESNFKHKIRVTAYPCRERRGLVWAYMGPAAELPELPAFEWNLVPEEQRFIDKTYQECNWVQAVEGGIDTSHGGFLHSGLVPGQKDPELPGIGVPFNRRDRAPRFEVVETDYGVLIGARRNWDEGHDSYGITQFLMPFYSMIPGGIAWSANIGGHAWVPMDDEHTMTWTVSWHPSRAFTEADLTRMNTYPQSGIHVGRNALLPPSSEPMGAWRPIPNKSNDYLIDREAQRTRYYTGIGDAQMGNTRIQDGAIQEGMGPIYDRTKEHLGTTDMAIIQVRRYWLRAARALREQGTIPPGVLNPESYRVRSAGVVLPKDAATSWVEASQELRKAL